MDTIKIVYVVTNLKGTGPINQTLNIIRYMDRTVFEPSVITLFPEDDTNTIIEEYRRENIPIYQLNLSKMESLIKGRMTSRTVLEKIRPNIIQGVGFPPLRPTLSYKEAKHMITLRNYCYEDYPDKYGRFLGPILAFRDVRLIKKMLSKEEPIITCSKSLSDMYGEKIHLDFLYIRNGVELSKYTKRDIHKVREIRNRLNLPQDKRIFLYSGNMIDRKNQKEAIDGFLKSQSGEKAVLMLLGDGVNLDDLKRDYGKYKNVIFYGMVKNVSEFLKASDVYVSSSKSEGLPNGVLEAMATGIPLILSDIVQHKEIFSVSGDIGYLYSLGDVDDLANKIDLMSDSDIYEMGEACYNVVIHNFSAKVMSEKYQDYYKKVLGLQS